MAACVRHDASADLDRDVVQRVGALHHMLGGIGQAAVDLAALEHVDVVSISKVGMTPPSTSVRMPMLFCASLAPCEKASPAEVANAGSASPG